jgi:hypothetical protein
MRIPYFALTLVLISIVSAEETRKPNFIVDNLTTKHCASNYFKFLGTWSPNLLFRGRVSFLNL